MGEPNNPCFKPSSPYVKYAPTPTTSTTLAPEVDFFILPTSGAPCPEMSLSSGNIWITPSSVITGKNYFTCFSDSYQPNPCVLEVDKYIRVADLNINTSLCNRYKLEISNIIVPTTTTTTTAPSTTTTTSNPSNTYPSLVGWNYGLGRCANFSNVMGIQDLQNINYNRLVRNISQWLVKSKPNPKIIATTTTNGTADSLLLNCLNNISNNVSILNKTCYNYDGSNLSGTDLFIITCNYNWAVNATDLNLSIQTQLVNFVNNGGAILTCEWLLWRTSLGFFQILKSIFPVNATTPYANRYKILFTQVTSDNIVNAGLPTSWSWTPASVAGTDTYFSSIKSGSTVFYNGSSI